jgi:hypothetical protein
MFTFLSNVGQILVSLGVLVLCAGVLVFAIFLVPSSPQGRRKKLYQRFRGRILPNENEEKEGGEEKESEEQDAPIQQEPEWWEKFPPIRSIEVLYWRGISKTWWWNNYAQELIEYAQEYLPVKRLELFRTYNSNSSGEDYRVYHDRVIKLRPKKVSKHPLVVINYDEQYYMVASAYDLEYMKDWIDAEWYRQYTFNKTYRRH